MKKKWLFIILIGFLFIFTGCSFNKEKEPNTIEQEPTIIQIQNEITELYKTLSPGCVGIYTSNLTTEAVGSGVVYKEDHGLYYVVTNNHVVEDMTTYKIYRGKSKYYRATLVGRDPKNDIAVLTFSLDLFGGEDVYVNDIFGYDEEIVIPGQTTLAIGCPLSLEYFNTLTTGVVSRVTNGLIQTNTEINPGNSGGGLFNLSGRLIGINTKKIASTKGEDNYGNSLGSPVEGIGFAISLDVVKKSIQDIENLKTVIERPMLNVTAENVCRYMTSTSDLHDYLPATIDEALVVTKVENGPAKNAGIHVFDTILEFDGNPCTTRDALLYYLNLKKKGETATLLVYRSETKQEITLNITF